MLIALLVLNSLVALASTAWAVVALVRPGIMSGSRQPAASEEFYARMYAARAIPLGLLTGIMPFLLRDRSVALVVLTAAAIQIFDLVIAAARRDPGMSIGSAIGAAVHLAFGLMLF